MTPQHASAPSRGARLLGIRLMLAGILLFSINDAQGKWLGATRPPRETPNTMLISGQLVATLVLGAVIAPIGWVTPSTFDFMLFCGFGRGRALPVHYDRVGGRFSGFWCFEMCQRPTCSWAPP